MASSSKRPKEAPTQGQSIKFLINIPLKVDLDNANEVENICKSLLNKLQQDIVDNTVKIEDVAIIFGLNGKFSADLKVILDELKESEWEHKIKHSKITFTWGEKGDIATKAKVPPYQNIREHLKNHTETKRLVGEMKKDDPSSLIYFSFVDGDTKKFNRIYSEYSEFVRKELAEKKTPPTVMSTGYEFDSGCEYHIASHLDRLIRVATAEVFPLGTYYPEPNFCVLVPTDENYIPESFINTKRKNMESPILISRVKTRKDFRAVFLDGNPIIIDVPDRFGLWGNGLQTNQSHLGKLSWARDVYVNGELQNKESTPGIVGKNRKFIVDWLKCEDDDEFKNMHEKSPFAGPGSELLKKAVEEVRELMKVIYELDKKFEEEG